MADSTDLKQIILRSTVARIRRQFRPLYRPDVTGQSHGSIWLNRRLSLVEVKDVAKCFGRVEAGECENVLTMRCCLKV